MRSKEATGIFILASYLCVVYSEIIRENQVSRKRRHGDDSIDLTLSNTIDITTEESNIWWPWASYEEWKRAHHFETGQTTGNSPGEVKSTPGSNAIDRAMADEAQTERRATHKRSKRRKSEEEKLKAKEAREEKRRQAKEEQRKRAREDREERRRRDRERKRKNGGRNRNIVVVDDDELEDGVWTLLQSRWGDYLSSQVSNKCSKEFHFCKPRCLIFNRTNSYICTCPSTHELQIEKHTCKRK